MISADKLLTEAQKHRIDDAVAAAGERTSARIIPVVVTACDQYERADELVGWWAAALGLALTGILVIHPVVPAAVRGSSAELARNLGIALAVIAAGAVIGGLLAGRIARLRRLFVTRRAMREAVERRARHILADCRLRSDSGDAGRPIVVILAGLYEGFVAVVADAPASAQLTSAAVESVRSAVLEGIASGRPCRGICQAIAIVAEAVGPACPAIGNRLEAPAAAVLVLD